MTASATTATTPTKTSSTATTIDSDNPVLTAASEACQRVINTYAELGVGNFDALRELYTEDVVFEDPAHHLEGLDTLIRYFEKLYTNVEQCRFEFVRAGQDENLLTLEWIMKLRHPRLQSGNQVEVAGCSLLRLDGEKIDFHRDYFDLGEMLYENLPLIGTLIGKIKSRLGQ